MLAWHLIRHLNSRVLECLQETCRLQQGSDPNPVIKQRKEGQDLLSERFCLWSSSCFFYFFHEKLFVLLSSATGPGYGQGVDVKTVSKLEINEVFHPERNLPPIVYGMLPLGDPPPPPFGSLLSCCPCLWGSDGHPGFSAASPCFPGLGFFF